MSFTVTINRHKLEFALESVAVYITDVAPELKKEPGTLLLVKLAKCVSVARGAVHVTFAPHALRTNQGRRFESFAINGAIAIIINHSHIVGWISSESD